MKKMLCMILALVMALSLAVPAFADVTNGASGTTTEVTYTPTTTGDVDTNGDGVTDENDDTDNDDDLTDEKIVNGTWTVIVPATMAPAGSDTVKAYGYWDSQKKLTVDAANTVKLTADGYSGEYNLDVTMSDAAVEATSSVTVTLDTTTDANGILTVGGSNTDNCYGTAKVNVAGFATGTAPLFGTWKGTFDYEVKLA